MYLRLSRVPLLSRTLSLYTTAQESDIYMTAHSTRQKEFSLSICQEKFVRVTSPIAWRNLFSFSHNNKYNMKVIVKGRNSECGKYVCNSSIELYLKNFSETFTSNQHNMKNQIILKEWNL